MANVNSFFKVCPKCRRWMYSQRDHRCHPLWLIRDENMEQLGSERGRTAKEAATAFFRPIVEDAQPVGVTQHIQCYVSQHGSDAPPYSVLLTVQPVVMIKAAITRIGVPADVQQE